MMNALVQDLRGVPVSGAGGDKGGGDTTPRAPVEAANTLRSRATARIIDLLSEGEIVGLVNGGKGIYFNDTPLLDNSGNAAFPYVTTAFLAGLPDQAPLSGFSAVESEVLVDSKVFNAVPIVKTVDDTNADAARVKIRIPALWTVDQTTGDVNPYAVTVYIDAKGAIGSYTTMIQETIQGKCVSPYEKAYRIPLSGLGGGPWNIRVRRISGDYDSVASAGDLYFASLTTIIEHKLIYPDSAVVGIACDARSFGGAIPTRSYLIDGLKIQVPTNYNPTTRAYTGSWDGTFKTAFSNNPAWVFYAVATNPRYGLGEFVTSTQLDKWNLYQIAQYCDELVNNGSGGTEPRFTFNGVISDREEAYRVLLALASVFRGMVYFSAGSIFAAADIPDDPVKLVSPANVVGGEFKYEGSSLKSRHSVILVSWNDPADGYRTNIEVVEDPDAIDSFGYRPLEITAVGCTSRGQARRYGKWVLETEQYETEVVTYACSWDHADLFPGQLIKIADPAYAGARMAGRVVSASGATVVLDDAVALSALETYTLDCILPDGTMESRAVVTSGVTTDTLTLASAFSDDPIVGAMWMLTASNLEPRLFRIVSISESEKNVFEVSALFHSPGKYDRVESNLVVEDPDYTVLPTGPIAAPTNLNTSQYLYESGAGAILGALTVSWSGSPDPRVVRYEVETARRGLAYEREAFSATTSLDITGIARTETSIGVRVRAVDDFGHASPWLGPITVAATMFSAPPADVTGLRGTILGDVVLLSWSPNSSRGLSHYIVRSTPNVGSATWGTAQIVASHVVGTSVQLPAVVGSYLIKAVSLAGVQSVNAVVFESNVEGLTGFNAVEAINAGPTWSGTLDNVVDNAGNLELDDPTTEGTITFAAIDLGEVFTSRVSASILAHGSNPSNVLSSWATLSSVDTLSGADPSSWNALWEERHTNDDPSGSPTWSDWVELQVGDIAARGYQGRLRLQSFAPPITPSVESASFTVDMPDRHIAEKGLTSGTAGGGYRVDYDPALRGKKAGPFISSVLATGDYYEFPASDETGFNIRFKNAAGTVVSRVFDFHTIGWGSVG